MGQGAKDSRQLNIFDSIKGSGKKYFIQKISTKEINNKNNLNCVLFERKGKRNLFSNFCKNGMLGHIFGSEFGIFGFININGQKNLSPTFYYLATCQPKCSQGEGSARREKKTNSVQFN